jgi:hypothetical protein
MISNGRHQHTKSRRELKSYEGQRSQAGVARVVARTGHARESSTEVTARSVRKAVK